MAALALTTGLVADATGGALAAGGRDRALAGVSIDSRTIDAGALFIALAGARFDGHDYIAEAERRGAAAVLVSRPVRVSSPETVVIQVPDTLAGLQALGGEIRRRSGATVIAITGSAGKTTTKELTASLLATRYRVFRNQGNLNNHIGLPLSLTQLVDGPDFAVVELGMNHAGEIRRLVAIARPDARIWTNVGDAHIGHFGTREGVARAKAEILEDAGPGTRLFANADDRLVMAHVAAFPGRLVTFGIDTDADVRATDVVDRGCEGVTATLRVAAGAWPLRVPLPGRAHLLNALAASAVALEYGIEPAAIVAGLASARPVAGRGAVVALGRGIRVVDDSYNASPAAVRTMLAALASTPATGRRVAVLGEMLELGDAAMALHADCGRAAVESGVDVLVAVGGAAADGYLSGALAAGLPPDRARRFADAASSGAAIAALLRPGDLVLVKGSRSTRTDRIVDALVAAEGRA